MLKGNARIAIVGAGFSGTACLAMIHQLSTHPVEIFLFDKTGEFAAGHAYRTPFPFHLLNARARDMSAYADDPEHFTNWLLSDKEARAYIGMLGHAGEQFVPRFLYGLYLRSILNDIRNDHTSAISVNLISEEVIDISETMHGVALVTDDGREMTVDRVILATGVVPAGQLPFPVTRQIQNVIHPWNYVDVQHIEKDASVLIVGTGLSMIDAVLTLHHQQHRGCITAVSRHGLLPLPHAVNHVTLDFQHQHLPFNVRKLMRQLRHASQEFAARGGDWRTIMNTLRPKLPDLWRALDIKERRRFMRHVLPYWNVHRHRVHDRVYGLLEDLIASGQLIIHAGHVVELASLSARVRPRGSRELIDVPASSVISCMGFSLAGTLSQQSLPGRLIDKGVATLDPLGLGLAASPVGALKNKDGQFSETIFALGPLLQGEGWETVAVPEIREQCADLAAVLTSRLIINKENYHEPGSFHTKHQ